MERELRDAHGHLLVFIGEYKITAGLVIIYAVSQVVRQLLQPKLVGDSMGMIRW